MSHRPVHICFFLFATIVASSVPAFSDPKCKPVVGSFEAHLVTPAEGCLACRPLHRWARLGRNPGHVRIHDDQRAP
jgi:hypothetical protein